MTINKLTNSIHKILITNLVLILTLISTNALYAKHLEPKSDLKGIIGVWQLKRTIPDKKSNQIKGKFLPVMATPESLILAVEEGIDEITINEGFKEFIQTQTLPTDGSTVTKNVQQIGKVSAKAFWENGKLVIETMTSKGDKMIKIFELSPNQKQLNVTLQLTENSSTKTVKVRRVYQRVADLDENNTAKVDISIYPF